MPKRPSQHSSDDEASLIFKSALPRTWAISPIHPDYAKDYLVEMFEDQYATGKMFLVQQKGVVLKGKRRGSTISVRVNREHLRYYLKKVESPLFIVGVDIKHRKAFFQFAQRAISEDLKIFNGLAGGGKVTFRVPTENDVSNTALLAQQVESARAYMREKYPGSIAAAVDARQKSVSELDPNLSCEVQFVDGHEKIVLHPKAPYQFSFILAGDPTVNQKKVESLLAYGTPIVADEFTSIAVEGSPAFKLFGNSVAAVGTEPQNPVEVTLFAQAADGVRHFTPEFRGHLSGGTRLLRFVAQMSGCPLQAEIELSSESRPHERIRCRLNWKWAPSAWLGQPLATLPYLDRVRPIVECLGHPESRLGFNISRQGNVIADESMQMGAHSETFRPCLPFIDAMIDARKVAKALSPHVTMPERWEGSDYDDLEELLGLVERRVYIFPKKVNFNGTIEGECPEIPFNEPDGVLEIREEGVSYTFLGQTILFPRFMRRFSNWKEAKVVIEGVNEIGAVRRRITLVAATMSHILPE